MGLGDPFSFKGLVKYFNKKIKIGGRISVYDYREKFPGVTKAVNYFSKLCFRNVKMSFNVDKD